MTGQLKRQLLHHLGSGHDIFLSHARSDGGPYAARLQASLEARGYDVFLDRTELEPGDSLSEEVLEGVQRSAVLLVVGTTAAFKSHWVGVEIDGYLESHAKDPRLIRMIFEGHPLPTSYRHTHRLGDTLGVADPDGPEAGPSPEVVNEVERHFKGRKARTRRLLAIAGLVTLITGGGFFAKTKLDAQARASRVMRHMSEGRELTGQLFHGQAEDSFRRAWEESGQTSSEARAALRNARLHRALTLVRTVEAPDSRLLGIADGPTLVLESSLNSRISILTPTGTTTLSMGAGDRYASVVMANGRLALWNEEFVWVHDIDDPLSGTWLENEEGCVDLAWGGDCVVGLHRTAAGVDLCTRPLSALGDFATESVELPEGAIVTTLELIDGERIFAAGDQSNPDGGYVPTAWIWSRSTRDWTAHPMSRELSLQANCFHAWVSESGSRSIIALSPLDFSSAGANQPQRNLYRRFDGFDLPRPMDGGSIRPHLMDDGPIDVIYLTETGDLKWQAPPPVIVTQVSPETLASGVEDFVAVGHGGDRLPHVIASDTSGTITVFHNGLPWSRYIAESESDGIMRSPSGRWVATQGPTTIKAWSTCLPEPQIAASVISGEAALATPTTVEGSNR